MRHTVGKDGQSRLVGSKMSKQVEEGHLKEYARILKYGRSAHADEVWNNRNYEQICSQYKEALAKRGAQNANSDV